MKVYNFTCHIIWLTHFLVSIFLISSIHPMEHQAQRSQEDTIFARLLTLANSDNAEAQYVVADCYYSGKRVARSVELAKNYFQRAASQGYVHASQRLGAILLLEGRTGQAVAYLLKAAEGNERLALYELSKICAYRGAILEEVKWLEKVISEDQPPMILGDNDYLNLVISLQAKAACRLGEIYEQGTPGLQASRELALASYKKATQFKPDYVRAKEKLACLEPTAANLRLLAHPACEADAGAQCLLGKKAYERNDFKSAIECFKRVAADSVAQYYLGMCLEKGQGVDKDYHNALAHFRASAEQGYQPALQALQRHGDHPGAQCVLGKLHRIGKGIAKDEETALRLLCSSHKLGCPQAINELKDLGKTNHKAQFAIGTFYEEGQGFLADIDEAANWYHKAAMGRNEFALCALIRLAENKNIKAALLLADVYDVEAYFKDYEKCRAWLLIAIDEGSGEAAYKLGMIYCSGTHVSIDEEQGIKWLVKAAELHYRPAFELLREMAQKGNILAQYSLGLFFHKGPQPDPRAAIHWLQKAGSLKHGAAFMRLAELEEYKPATLSSLVEIIGCYNRVDTQYIDAVECGLKEAIKERTRISAILTGFQEIAAMREKQGLGQVSLRAALFLRLKAELPSQTAHETYYWAAHICGLVSHYYGEILEDIVYKVLLMIAKLGREERVAYAYLKRLSFLLLSSEFLDNPLDKEVQATITASIEAIGRRALLTLENNKKFDESEKKTRTRRVLLDFAIDSFNKRMFSEEKVNEKEFDAAVIQIIELFNSLEKIIKKRMLWDESSERLADAHSLRTMLTHSKTNRCRQSIIKIAHILTTKYTQEEAASVLCRWALAGLYAELHAEEEIAQFVRAQALTRASLDAQHYDLEMRIALCLAEGRRKAIEGLIKDDVQEKKIHCAYVRGKARQETTLVGMAESLDNRLQESLVGEVYKTMSAQSIVEKIMLDFNEVSILMNEINNDATISIEMVRDYCAHFMGSKKAAIFLESFFVHDEESKRYVITQQGAKALLCYFGYFE